jgi:hypothetical protein
MTLSTRPLIEVTEEAIRLLYQQLGVVDTVRFLNQFTTGLGDYTQERDLLFADKTLDELISEIKQQKPLED